MTDTSGYTSADGFNNMQSNNSNNNISANSNARILYEHQDRNKLPSPSANYAQNLNCSEEILIDPTALQASDLSLINQGQQRQQQKHPQENMSQYQKHQIKQYYKQMDVNNEQLQQNNNNNNSMSDDTFMDLQLTQHQQQLQLFQQQHQIQTSPSKQSFNGHSNFKIVPTPIQGVPNAGSKPVLVFVNPRSGGNQGAKMMQKFNWLLNPRQVFDLIEAGGPRAALELYRDVPNLRILTIGGDGTASWILSYLDEVGIPNKIPVAVLPLGTGNDLARALGWGGGYTDEPIAKILTQVRDGEIVQLDRWNLHVEKNYEVAPVSPNEFSTGSGNALTNSTMEISPSSITSSPSYFNSLTPSSTTTTFNQQTSTPLSTISIIDDSSSNQQQSNVVNNDEIGCDRLPMDVINNYFSFGVDAHIALEFHTAREAHPERFNSRLRNKMFYGQAGGKDLLKRKWKDLSNFVTLYCDGQDMTGRLKELKVHSVLFLNIPSYGGGTRPWPTTGATSSVFSKPRTDDGMIEVIGLTTYQLPLLQAGGHGTCIAQCRNAKIITSRTIPMQVDGEPCKLLPSIINIGFRNRVCMLAKSKSSNKNNINMTTSNIQKMN